MNEIPEFRTEDWRIDAMAQDKETIKELRVRIKELEAVLGDALACALKGNALAVESVIETGWHGE